MSEEIIKVLDYLGAQIGIAIDWTSENVWPQIMDILGRYRLLEIITNCLWIFAEIALIIYALIVTVKCFKAHSKLRTTKEDNFWWTVGYSTSWMSGPGIILVITAAVFGILSLVSIPMEIGELLKWLIVPEIKYLEMLKGLMA